MELAELIQQHAVLKPEEFILEKLKTNRIVMVSDFQHGQRIYYQTVIKTLNEWLRHWEQADSKSDSIPSKLFLIIEHEAKEVQARKNYMRSGNINDMLEPGLFDGYQFTAATIEYLNDLGDIFRQVEEFNKKSTHATKLTFDIVGPEKPIDIINWSFQKRDHFFIYERDEYSSAYIKSLLDSVTDAKAIVYYGGAHFVREKVRKQAGKESGMGWYLAHYLTESFQNKGGVYICGQIPFRYATFLDPAFYRLKMTYAIDNSIFKGVALSTNGACPSDDGTIFHNIDPVPGRHISKIWSETFVDFIIAHLDSSKDVKNDFHRSFLSFAFEYLSIIADKDFDGSVLKDSLAIEKAIGEYKAWRKSTKLDIVDNITKLVLWKRMIDRIGRTLDPLSTQYQLILADMVGFKVWFQNGASPQERAKHFNQFLERYRNEVIQENLIYLMWVGTSLEKEKAIKYLINESGQHFTTAKQWTIWWESSKSD